MDNSKNIMEDEKGLVVTATGYLKTIFKSSYPNKIDDSLGNISMTITYVIN